MSRKSKRVVFIVLTAMLFFVLACSTGETTPQGEERQQSGVTPVPEAPTQAPPVQARATATGSVQEEETRTEEGVCQGNRWRIIPLAVYEYPQGDGWKFLVVPLAVENGSEVWGNIVGPVSYSNYRLTSEDGYMYEPFSGGFLKLPPGPTSPYTEYAEAAKQNGFFVHSQILIPGVLPPGFRARGWNFIGGGHLSYWGEPDGWSQLVFQVAESQSRYKVAIQNAGVRCILPDGSMGSEILEPLVLDLSSDTTTLAFPGSAAIRVMEDLSSPFELAGASLQITELYRDDYYSSYDGGLTDDMVVIKFRVENRSGGYEASGTINSYLIGDDGLIRIPGCSNPWFCQPGISLDNPSHTGRFQVGPGQVGEASIGFIAHPSTGNLKFVVADQTGVYLVFDLPDDF